MSGHSHAKTVARTKNANAEKRGKIFSKLSKMISVVAKDGTDPASNSKLKQAIDEAKKANMPKDNIEKAIKRGSGELAGDQLEEVTYEAIGPNGISVIIEGITDNKNRTLSEVKQIINKYGGKLANEGSLKWLFEKMGIIVLSVKKDLQRDELELKIIEAGADDLNWYNEEGEEFLEIHCTPDNLESTKKSLQQQGLEFESASLGWLAKEEITIPANEMETCQKMFADLDENDAVQNVFSNLKN